MTRLFSALRASHLDSSSLAAWLGKWQAEAARTRIAQVRAPSHSLLGLEMWSPRTSLSFGGSPRWKVALGWGMNESLITSNLLYKNLRFQGCSRRSIGGSKTDVTTPHKSVFSHVPRGCLALTSSPCTSDVWTTTGRSSGLVAPVCPSTLDCKVQPSRSCMWGLVVPAAQVAT